jgi:hypothetical protein
MPVVLRVDGFSFGFFSNDHDPPHVHVRYGGSNAIIEIDSLVVRKTGLRTPDLATARTLVRVHRAELLARWIEWKLTRKG